MRLNTKSLPTNIAALSCILLFALLCLPLFSNRIPYLDDYYLILLQKQEGFWAPTLVFQGIWGSYRWVYTTLMSPLYALGDNLWIARSAGLLLHMGNAWLLFRIAGRLSMSEPAQLLVLALFVLFPFSLEAIAWPSNVTQYPLAPFLMLSGVALVLSSTAGRSKLIIGSVLLGGAVWIHEQVGPIIIFFLIICSTTLKRKQCALFLGISAAFIAANFILIYATRNTNIRLTGENAGNVGNIYTNLLYFRQLVQTTPIGSYFYATEGLPSSPTVWILAVAVAIFVTSVLINRSFTRLERGVNASERQRSRWFWPIMLWLASGAYIVSLTPIVMSPIPWHTGRVIYIPFIGFSLMAGLAAQSFIHFFAYSRAAAIATAIVVMAVVVWSAVALRAEANALNSQVKINFSRAESFKAIVASEISANKTVVVVGGFPGTDNDRPAFGEHFSGISPAEFKVALGMRMVHPPTYPLLIARSMWDHLCKGGDGYIQLNRTILDARTLTDVTAADAIVFVLWSGGEWKMQRQEEKPLEFSADVPKCIK